jgi:hypothetical protein
MTTNRSIAAFLLFSAVASMVVLAAVLSSSPAWFIEGTDVDESVGCSVAMADVNGDDSDDLIVASRTFGKIQVFFGSAMGPASAPSQVFTTTESNAGRTLVAPGDWNSDTYDDLAVAEVINGEPGVGIWLGSPSGLTGVPAWRTVAACCRLGAGGDINGDGYDDLLVGDPEADTGMFQDAGRAYLFLGGPGASEAAAWTIEGDGDFVRLGLAVAGAGDTNGDGFGDIIVSEPTWHDTQGNRGGKVFVFAGTSTSASSSPMWINTGSINSLFGSTVGPAGDVNRDGYADIVIGDNQANVGVKRGSTQTGQKRGKAFVYHGSPSGPSMNPAWTAIGSEDGDFLGDAIVSGDVNNDGYTDLVVSAPQPLGIYNHNGKVYLYLGSAKGLEKTAAWSVAGPLPLAGGALFLLALGDSNGDSLGDVLVGMPGFHRTSDSVAGRVELYLGGGQ